MSTKSHQSASSSTPALFPPRLERLQIKYFNPLVAPLAGRVPFFAVIMHHGRRSGREYRTTVRAFTKGGRLAIMLVHGQTDWVRNVLAAGGADVGLARRTVHVHNPRVLPVGSRDPRLPLVARIFLRRTAVLIADLT